MFEIDTHLTQPNIDASFLLQYTQTRSQLYPHLATLSRGRILSMSVSQQMKKCLGTAMQIWPNQTPSINKWNLLPNLIPS